MEMDSLKNPNRIGENKSNQKVYLPTSSPNHITPEITTIDEYQFPEIL